MVTDMRPQLKEVRDSLLRPPTIRQMLDNAIARYESRAHAWAGQANSSDNPTAYLTHALDDLEDRVASARESLRQDPRDIQSREVFDDLRADHHVLQQIKVDDNKAIAPKVKRHRAHQKQLEILEQEGLVVRVSEEACAAKQLASALEYQVVVYDRKFEIPGHFAHRLLKSPSKTNKYKVDMCISDLMEQELIQATKDIQEGPFNFDTIAPNDTDSPAVRALKKSWLNALTALFQDEGIYRKEGKRDPSYMFARAKEFREMLGKQENVSKTGQKRNWKISKKRRDLAVRAKEIVKDLIPTRHLRLMRSDHTLDEFRINGWMPEETYRESFEDTDPKRRYLGMTYTLRGHGQSLFLLTNAIDGMKMMLYSLLVEDLKKEGYTVRQSDIIRFSKNYAKQGRMRGSVLSKSGIRQQNQPVAGAMFNTEDPDNHRWVQHEAVCDCDDWSNLARLRSGKVLNYEDSHVSALRFRRQYAEVSKGREPIDQVPLADEELAYMDRKFTGQALIMTKADGSLKTPNRSEREASLTDYMVRTRSFRTVDFRTGVDAVKRLYTDSLKVKKE
ncbi:TPA: hypothetical protein HA265_06015 [Candidatus Woesearchaeota archaeon]|nr:hypothetical protein [Candidatus Woesearchaeota archaeon]